MMETPETTTQEQMDPRAEALLKRKENIEGMMADLEKRMEDVKYQAQVYKKGAIVEVPGEVFASWINTMATVKNVLYRMQESMGIVFESADQLMDYMSETTVKLMDLHLDQVDKGNTIPSSEIKDEINGDTTENS